MSLSLPGGLSLIRSVPFSQVSTQVVVGGVPDSQVPRPSQVSSPLQRSPSVQELPGASYWHVDEQQSPSAVLPSSHCSGTVTTPSPHEQWFSKKIVLPDFSPTKASRSPSPSMSASAGEARSPTSARPNGLVCGAAKAGAAAVPVFSKKKMLP